MKLFQILIISFLILVNSISIAFCQDITLSWDPSPSSGVDGYKVYYKQGDNHFPFDGTGAYIDGTPAASPVDVGNILSTTLTNLTDDTTYFFSVTAYDNDASAESSYSNIVSNSWLPGLVIPTEGATSEPIPTTFRWETAPAEYDVTYTLFYGTDQNEVATATSSIVVLPPASGGNNMQTGILAILATLLVVLGLNYRPAPQLKRLPQYISLLLVIFLGGILTACGGGGGGGDSSSDRSVSTPAESVLYSINKGSSDYHQAFSPEVEASTTYYWKVVATDTQDPNLTYESEVRSFTTE
ncbi:MAG: fibronectin type III domain-containing protein [Thermodesulfobacteriota bacterium]|nr:fibronectin type III domain-containing protein [Thermodesulfobacteriota bacterium]